MKQITGVMTRKYQRLYLHRNSYSGSWRQFIL